ncbi:hypothetical protein MSIBF_A1650004 [groundwater metagenome]|uniref:Methanogenesis regulatory protein FilR1 middle domain-containing protein n=1 Tax=groundwater metagenome TaxID=717931 RepID=A0A098E6W0_9ZZZZ
MRISIYMEILCLEYAVKVLLNINGKRDIKELQKISGAKSLKTTYNILNNLSELHLIEFKRSMKKPNLSPLGNVIKIKLSELEQLMETKEYVGLFSSYIKLRAILFMNGVGMYASDIHDEIYSESRGTTNHILVELEDDKIIEPDFMSRKLSKKGIMLKEKIVELLKTLLVIKRHKEYLNEHQINIPDDYLPLLHTLHNAEIIKDSFYDNMIVFNTVRRMALTGNYLCCVVSGYAENYICVVGEAIKKGIVCRVIISKNVKENIEKNKEIFEMINAMKKNKNSKLMLSKNVDKFTMLLTDKEIALFLFKRNGNVEWYEYLHCKDECCVHFGNEIFKFYEKEAIEI